MKVIFLDIDGVLNNVRSNTFGELWNESGWDHACIANLIATLDSTKAKIVISSTWRLLFSKEELEAMFLKRFGFELPIIGRTPTPKEFDRVRFSEVVEGVSRGKEIQVWLDRHPEVERFVILDDDSDMLESQLPFFVQTDFENGLTWADARVAINILNGD